MSSVKPEVWMPLYLGDYASSAGHLSTTQDGAYFRLLRYQWKNGHFSADEIPSITGLAGDFMFFASSATQAEAKQWLSTVLAPVLKLLSVDDDGLYYSPRLDRELYKAVEKKRVFIERASKGGKATERRRRERVAKEEAYRDSFSTTSSGSEASLQKRLRGSTSPSPSQEKQVLPPNPPAAIGVAAGGLPPHPAPPLGEKPAPGASSAPSASSANSEQKAKGPEMPPGRAAAASVGGRVPESVARRTTQIAAPASRAPRSGEIGKKPRSADPRILTFQEEILKFWSGQNPKGPVCPWSRQDYRALVEYLAGSPNASLEHFKHLLKNRAASQINPSTPARKWLRDLEEYADGPLDRYKKSLRGVRRL